jgi:hypothetical protein
MRRRGIPMPAGVGCLTRPAWGCLGYPIFILDAVLEARSHSLETTKNETAKARRTPGKIVVG